jgi:hypothetical protein
MNISMKTTKISLYESLQLKRKHSVRKPGNYENLSAAALVYYYIRNSSPDSKDQSQDITEISVLDISNIKECLAGRMRKVR